MSNPIGDELDNVAPMIWYMYRHVITGSSVLKYIKFMQIKNNIYNSNLNTWNEYIKFIEEFGMDDFYALIYDQWKTRIIHD